MYETQTLMLETNLLVILTLTYNTKMNNIIELRNFVIIDTPDVQLF
jgi:hypothetical protein